MGGGSNVRHVVYRYRVYRYKGRGGRRGAQRKEEMPVEQSLRLRSNGRLVAIGSRSNTGSMGQVPVFVDSGTGCDISLLEIDILISLYNQCNYLDIRS